LSHSRAVARPHRWVIAETWPLCAALGVTLVDRRVCSVVLAVRTVSRAATRGVVEVGGRRFACALGRSGASARKREGDGATPIGTWRLERVLYRAGHGRRPRTGLPLGLIGRHDGWCDATGDRNYNRPVRLPYPVSAEAMWRTDGLYDIIVVLAHNRRPRQRGLGSAIFMHVAWPDYRPTEGCIALSERDLRLMLAECGRGARVQVEGRRKRKRPDAGAPGRSSVCRLGQALQRDPTYMSADLSSCKRVRRGWRYRGLRALRRW
jgi:L,D-peptidoglycan transpeptidase YkuD (ErfK/YbiS/YcfS/YnhG family)